MRQSALTLIAPIREGGLEPLRSLFQERQVELKEALRGIGSIHYARWVIIEQKNYRPLLAFSSNFDGPIEAQVDDLVRALGNHLDPIYQHCENYTPESKVSYLRNIRVGEAAFYQGAPGRTVKTIADEKALRQRILEALEAEDWTGQKADQIHKAIKAKVLADPAFAWAKDPLEAPKVHWPYFILVLILLSPVLLFLPIWAIYIQLFHERFDKPDTTDPNDVSDKLIAENVRDEDFFFQNQFSQIMLMKPGLARRFTLNLMFFLTRILIRNYFVTGKLMGIPTIHFARWVRLKDGRLLFFSNFDGSWTQYLGDFIDKSGWGLNAIFGNTGPFPRVKFLFLRGAYDEMHFLGWSRSTQIPTQLWHAASVDQSIKNINQNTLTRNDLGRDLNEKQAEAFLSRI